MDFELLLIFIGYFPGYLSALLRTLLRLFWTTFVETAVYLSRHSWGMGNCYLLQVSFVVDSRLQRRQIVADNS